MAEIGELSGWHACVLPLTTPFLYTSIHTHVQTIPYSHGECPHHQQAPPQGAGASAAAAVGAGGVEGDHAECDAVPPGALLEQRAGEWMVWVDGWKCRGKRLGKCLHHHHRSQQDMAHWRVTGPLQSLAFALWAVSVITAVLQHVCPPPPIPIEKKAGQWLVVWWWLRLFICLVVGARQSAFRRLLVVAASCTPLCVNGFDVARTTLHIHIHNAHRPAIVVAAVHAVPSPQAPAAKATI